MRLPDDVRFARRAAWLILPLAGCALVAAAPRSAVTPPAANGPQADYPVVVGEPYSIAGQGFTPEDVLNYDEVGVIAADAEGGSSISAAHHTLPLPSYVEVTSLETGRTILARLERRGPKEGTQLIALSPGALTQLGAAAGTPVRVRRVNPPEDQRAVLRAGQAAPLRMDTPMSLVAVLKRKLGAGPSAASVTQPSAPAIAAAPAARPVANVAASPLPLPALAGSEPKAPPPEPSPAFAAAFTPEPAPPAKAPSAPRAGFLVQAAAFSTQQRAQSAAKGVGGTVVPAGKFFRVRTGPFTSRAQAEASLAKVRAKGYRDARILTSG